MSRTRKKSIAFVGSSLEELRSWPAEVKQEAGYQLDRVQQGLDPDNWKPFATIGPGVREIRLRANGQWRVIYVQVVRGTVHVLHCFRKKTQKTAKADIEIAKTRLKALSRR